MRLNLMVRLKPKEVERVLSKDPNRYQPSQTTKVHLTLKIRKDILRIIHLSQVQLPKLVGHLKATNKLKQEIKLDPDQTTILLDKITQDPNKWINHLRRFLLWLLILSLTQFL